MKRYMVVYTLHLLKRHKITSQVATRLGHSEALIVVLGGVPVPGDSKAMSYGSLRDIYLMEKPFLLG